MNHNPTHARWRLPSRKGIVFLFLALIPLLTLGVTGMILMPGKSYQGALPPLNEREEAIRDRLRQDVQTLAGEIGERNVAHPEQLSRAAEFLFDSFRAMGYAPQRQSFPVIGFINEVTCENIIAERPGSGRADEIIVVGGHYDSVVGTVGANDNGSGAAAVLALAWRLAETQPERTLRFVEFVNEEPPFFLGDQMGSVVYAKSCRDKNENIVGMFSLETIGYYSDAEGSQQYPPLLSYLFPSTGNFIGFVGNLSSRKWVREVVGEFRRTTRFPSEGGIFPEGIPGVGWSDHNSFWKVGYPALMVTDTAPFRYPHYHKASDTPDQIDYDRMARVVAGLESVLLSVAAPQRP